MCSAFPANCLPSSCSPGKAQPSPPATLDAGTANLHLPEWLYRAAVKAGYTVSELMNDKFAGSVRKGRGYVVWPGH